MSITNYHIDRYQYDIRIDAADGLGRELGILYLYDTDKTLRCVVAFRPLDAALEPPAESANGYVALQMHSDKLPQLIDMLRNEKPVYFAWSAENRLARITTGEEPVGEQELRKLFSFLYV